MAAKATHWRAWATYYGLDKRQARRLRRRTVQEQTDPPCNAPNCILKGGHKSALHLSPTGPFVGPRIHWCDEATGHMR